MTVVSRGQSSEGLYGLLRRFLETEPLYRKATIRPIFTGSVREPTYFPPSISVRCRKCDHKSNWVQNPERYIDLQPFVAIQYQCCNCNSETFTFLLKFELREADTFAEEPTLFVQKVGQFPAQEITPPKELEKVLGKHTEFYKKGMTCRHYSYGIGAHAYFRRLIEETVTEMLNALAAALQQSGTDARVLKKVEEAKRERRFEKKAKLAADVLPQHL